MAYENYKALRIAVARGVARVTIDHGEINLFDLTLIIEMARLGAELEADDEARVVVLQSANPHFFIAHADLNLIQGLPAAVPARAEKLGGFHSMCERFRVMPKATIAKIEGICRGGGSEFVQACDMRFAARGRAVLSQPEVALGIIPGGGGCVRLPRLIGRSRALEVILGCDESRCGSRGALWLCQSRAARERDRAVRRCAGGADCGVLAGRRSLGEGCRAQGGEERRGRSRVRGAELLRKRGDTGGEARDEGGDGGGISDRGCRAAADHGDVGAAQAVMRALPQRAGSLPGARASRLLFLR